MPPVYERPVFMRREIINWITIAAVLFSITVCAAAAGSPAPEIARIDTFSRACQYVYEGKFDSVTDLISTQDRPQQPLSEVAAIAVEYEALAKSREDFRGRAYEKKKAKLQNMRWGTDPNDANDVNEPASVFSAVLSLLDIADANQKLQILDTPILKEAIEKAKTEAQKHEEQGKWFDAYTACWYWMSEFEEDNPEYKQHTEDLVEKAGILGAFQDSPCETRAQRFEKVEPEMFKRAVDEIDRNYVNPLFIDYSEMALKGLRRSRLLAEVVRCSYDEIEESKNDKDTAVPFHELLYRPDQDSIDAWNAALDALKADVEQAGEGFSRERFLDVFNQVLLLNTTTVMLPKSILIVQFSEAALMVLDPHTVIVWPERADDFKKGLTGEFSGIGIVIQREKGLLKAASLLPDTPAYKSGLDAGDIIEMVDDVPTKDMPLNCAVKHITGPSGTDVKLTVRTPGEDTTRDLIITRAKIVVRTIRGWQRDTNAKWKYMIDEKRRIGYVRLTSFNEKSAAEFETVLKELEGQDVKGLILDLRSNLGGLLESARDICNKFISKGLIVRTQPRWGIPSYLTASSYGTHPDYPLVILVNRHSASASEIVSGALQDPKYNRAVIVGERTHGKGSVQQLSYRPGGGATLKYTIAYYHLPSGQRVESREDMEKLGRDDWGITPDVAVKLIPDEMKKLFDFQRDNDLLAKADHDLDAAPLKKHTIEDTLDADPQLKVALLVVRTKLLEQGRAVAASN